MDTGTNSTNPKEKYFTYLTVKVYNNFVPRDINTDYGNDFFLKDDSPLWRKILKSFPNLLISKLFISLSTEKINELITKGKSLDPLYHPQDLHTYFSIACPEETNPDDVSGVLIKSEWVELAYIHGRRTNPPAYTENSSVAFLQKYLNAAPEGIDAKYAWKVAGGRGDGNVKFIDVEQGWKLDHELIKIETLPLTGVNEHTFQYHGTAVLGVIMMKENNSGGVGITPEATGYVVSQWRPDGSPNEADAILAAISYLSYGDILLLESQSYHSETKDKLWPVEIHEATFQVIRLATALGIIVIEAGGNGDINNATGNDLDLLIINGKKIFNPGEDEYKDSGAILVAASVGLPHTRMRCSNYGSRINCYAPGEVVVGNYTSKLLGTSGATAIIAGAVITIQSISEKKNTVRLGPQQMRAIFSNASYGTLSANGHEKDKIGVMPDLKKIIEQGLKIYSS